MNFTWARPHKQNKQKKAIIRGIVYYQRYKRRSTFPKKYPSSMISRGTSVIQTENEKNILFL